MRQCNFDLDQRLGSPAAGAGEARYYPSTKLGEMRGASPRRLRQLSPKRSEGEGGQVEPVLGVFHP